MNKAVSRENPLAQDFGVGGLLWFSLPTMAAMLFMGLYTIVDTVFVSRFAGTDALSALNIVCPVINLIVGLGTMLAAGGSAILARKMGAGERKRAAQDFTLIILAGVLLGAAVAAGGTAFLDKLIWRLGASRRLFLYCREYLSVLLFFTPASILQVLFQNLLVTAGRPGAGMALGAGAGFINLVLDYVFMVPFAMGIRGAALGTGIGYLVPAAAGIFLFRDRRGSLHFERPVLDPSVLAECSLNGVSELVSQASAAVTTFLFNRVMMWLLGEDGVAAVTIMIYTQFLLTTLYIGFSMGVAPIISYRYGKGDREQLRRLMIRCVRIIAASSFLICASAFAAGPVLSGIFSDPKTPVYEIARRGFLIFPLGFLFGGFNIFTSAAFTALSNGRVSAALSFLRTFGLLTFFLLTLPKLWGTAGVWLAVPAAEFLTMLFGIWFVKEEI